MRAAVRRRWGLGDGGRVTVIDLGGLASAIATTGLWLLRLSSALATPGRVGRLTAPVAALPAAHARDAAIAVSRADVGPNLQVAAAHDGIPFHTL